MEFEGGYILPEHLTKEYIIIPKVRHSFLETDHYIRQLSTGKIANIYCTKTMRWGEAIVSINDAEKNELINNNRVCINDYPFVFNGSNIICSTRMELTNENLYTVDEMVEIFESACEPLEKNDESEPHEFRIWDCDSKIMEEEGWILDNTYYYINDGCILVPDGENIYEHIDLSFRLDNEEDLK